MSGRISKNDQSISLTGLAEMSGIRVSTLKIWTDLGLIPYLQTRPRSRRLYPIEASMARAQEIVRLKSQKKTLHEILATLRFPNKNTKGDNGGGEVAEFENDNNNMI